jgi:hypothetical protein
VPRRGGKIVQGPMTKLIQCGMRNSECGIGGSGSPKGLEESWQAGLFSVAAGHRPAVRGRVDQGCLRTATMRIKVNQG